MKIDKRTKSKSTAGAGGMVAAASANARRNPIGKGLVAVAAIVVLAMLAKAALNRKPAH